MIYIYSTVQKSKTTKKIMFETLKLYLLYYQGSKCIFAQ